MSAPANAARKQRRRARHQMLTLCGGLGLICLTLPVLFHCPMRLLWNASASVPLGLYRVRPATHPGLGNLVVVHPTPALEKYMAERRYVERHVPLVKPVAATGGARV